MKITDVKVQAIRIPVPQMWVVHFGKTMDVGADIDDTYAISMDFGDFYGNMTVDVVSRYATRSLILNMERGQILWRWDETAVKLYDSVNGKWTHHDYHQRLSASGYNQNITDDMYVDELASFIQAGNGGGVRSHDEPGSRGVGP